MINRLILRTERLTQWFAAIGGAIILVQMVWISYGVFKRYFLGNPDGMVTEATALLLFPVAFLGLAYALKENAYPTVTYAIDVLKAPYKRWLLAFNLLIMVGVGVFFAYAAVDAAFKSYASGSASEILLWPRYLFWIPSALALVLFAWYAILRLFIILLGKSPDWSDNRREP
jgi:TRAP-type C4-dicarboxylate transport system permease small subunit